MADGSISKMATTKPSAADLATLRTQKGIKGPAVFLAQFMQDEGHFSTLPTAAKWMGEAG